MLCWLLILLMECDSILVCLLYKWIGPFPLHFYIDYCFSIFDILTTAYLWEFFLAMSIWCSLYLYINYFFSITLVFRGFADLPVFLMFFSPFPSKSRLLLFILIHSLPWILQKQIKILILTRTPQFLFFQLLLWNIIYEVKRSKNSVCILHSHCTEFVIVYLAFLTASWEGGEHIPGSHTNPIQA